MFGAEVDENGHRWRRNAFRRVGRAYAESPRTLQRGEHSAWESEDDNEVMPDPKLPPPDPDPEKYPPGPAPAPVREPEEPGPDVIDPSPELLPA